MALINSGSFAKALWPGINAWYGKAYSEYPVEWDKLFVKNTSRKQFEEDVGISSFGLALVKQEGAPVQFDSERQSFVTRYIHIVYALGFIVTREIYEDDQYDVVGQRKAQGLAFSMRQTKEIVAANVYNRAFNSSYLGGDGVSLLNASHPLYAGGTFANRIATDADISEAALEQACIDIAGFTNDRGLKIAVRPKRLVIPKELMFEASRILNSEKRVGTDSRDSS
jgi:Mu-like prophage major head subunit gpT